MTILYKVALLQVCNIWSTQEAETSGKTEAECDELMKCGCRNMAQRPFVLHAVVIERTITEP